MVAQSPRAAGPVAGELGVGVVDLGHPLGRQARGRRIVAGQVRVMGPGEPAPGRLDLDGGRARLDAEDDMGIALCHGSSLSSGRRGARTLDRSATATVP